MTVTATIKKSAKKRISRCWKVRSMKGISFRSFITEKRFSFEWLEIESATDNYRFDSFSFSASITQTIETRKKVESNTKFSVLLFIFIFPWYYSFLFSWILVDLVLKVKANLISDPPCKFQPPRIGQVCSFSRNSPGFLCHFRNYKVYLGRSAVQQAFTRAPADARGQSWGQSRQSNDVTYIKAE